MSTVHQLKATIVGTKPPVWRRVVVSSDSTLAELHDVLQAAFGWWDCHLHEFEFGRVRYGIDDGEGWGDPPKDEQRAVLSRVAKKGSSFVYVYDFGDDWRHKVVVEGIVEAVPGVSYPTCVGGRRACPPEDCGGVWGFHQMLDVLADPTDEEHDSMLEWVGGAFDPAAFDPADFGHRVELGELAAL